MAKVFAAFANGVWFKAEPATKGCDGCIFDSERSAICREAGTRAVEAGMPDCDDTGPGASSYRYVRDPSDGRQLDVIESAS